MSISTETVSISTETFEKEHSILDYHKSHDQKITVFNVEVIFEEIVVNRTPIARPDTAKIYDNFRHLAEDQLLPLILSDTQLKVGYCRLNKL